MSSEWLVWVANTLEVCLKAAPVRLIFPGKPFEQSPSPEQLHLPPRPLRTLQPETLADLEAEFEDLLARLQTEKAKDAMKVAFDASPVELGVAAVSNRAPFDMPRQIARASIMEITGHHICLGDVVEKFETDLIRAALARVEGSQTLAARLLGITPSKLREKIKQHQISLIEVDTEGIEFTNSK